MSSEQGSSPRVSVVLPFYNAEKYLSEAIESVLDQDYADFELLLVDDGSPDASSVIARKYAAEQPGRIRVLEHPANCNRGTAASRNLALGHARGDLVAFIDADDRWRRSKLSDQLNLLDSMPEVEGVFGSVNYWSSYAGGEDEIVASGHVRNRVVRPPEALLKVYPLGKGNSPCPSDLMVRRSTVRTIGGFEEAFVGPLFLYEDQAFFLKLYAHATLFFSNQVWLDYRQHEQSCTAVGLKQNLGWESRRYCLEWFEGYLKNTRYRYDPRVRFALMRAMRPYRHPHFSAAGRRIKSLLRKVRAGRRPQNA